MPADKIPLSQQLADASAGTQHLVERIEAEIAFAEQLCELQKASARKWSPLVEKARAKVTGVLAGGRLEAVSAAVRDAEAILAPVGKAAKAYTAHCVGHAHIDMNWMWSWPETVSITIDTFSTVLRLMEEYPTFCFSQSQASTYAIIEQNRPDLLKRIAARVKEGRWEVTASHWVEGDRNMAGGESLCRHLLYTRGYMSGLFGLKPEDIPIDWSPDTFGHPATVPSYLAHGGVKYVYLHRPGVNTNPKHGAFWWEGPDGSRVLVRNDMELAYNGVINPAIAMQLAKFVKFTGGRNFMFVFGVGDHGGGPTRRDIVRGLDMDTWPVFPRIKFSTAKAFYGLLEQEGKGLPVVRGELNTEFTGCYTTQTLIKKANRHAEQRLIEAEFAAAAAAGLNGPDYPRERFRQAWIDTLFSHFHDILPGSGVHDTRTYTHGLFQKTVAVTASIEAQSLRHVAGLVDTTGGGLPPETDVPPSRLATSVGAGVGFRSADGALVHSDQSTGEGPRPFVIFNPTAIDREEVVEITVWDNAPGKTQIKQRSFEVVGPDGKVARAQVTGGGGFWGHDYATLSFPVSVKGLGYATYVVREIPPGTDIRPAWVGVAAGYDRKPQSGTAWLTGGRHHCSYAFIERTGEGLENDFVRVELDVTTGGIRHLRDKRSGVDLVTPEHPAPVLEYAVERPHGMNAWLIDNSGPVEAPAVTAIRRTQTGPFKAAIEVDIRVRESSLTVAYELRADDPALYVVVRGTWFQRGTPETGVPALSFALPLALEKTKAQYEIPFGAVNRDFNQHEEEPALNWAGVSGKAGKKTAGCLLLNDSKHGYSLDGSTLRLTLIRSAYEPDILPEIGQHEIRLAILPFAGNVPTTQAIEAGQVFNRPLKPVSTDVHKGRMAAAGILVGQLSGGVVLSGIKRSEDGRGLVVRLFNPEGRNVQARMETGNGILSRVAAVEEVDLMERKQARSTARLSGSAVVATIPAGGIVTLLLRK